MDSARLEGLEGVLEVIPVTHPYKQVSREWREDDTLVELPKSILQLVVVGSIAYMMVVKNMKRMPDLMQLSVAEILQEFGWIAFQIAFFVCLALIVLAAADYIFQHWQHEKTLRMTKQEVKDEQKQLMGDPQIKAKIKSAQREMARRRMMSTRGA